MNIKMSYLIAIGAIVAVGTYGVRTYMRGKGPAFGGGQSVVSEMAEAIVPISATPKADTKMVTATPPIEKMLETVKTIIMNFDKYSENLKLEIEKVIANVESDLGEFQRLSAAMVSTSGEKEFKNKIESTLYAIHDLFSGGHAYFGKINVFLLKEEAELEKLSMSAQQGGVLYMDTSGVGHKEPSKESVTSSVFYMDSKGVGQAAPSTEVGFEGSKEKVD